MQHVHFLPRAFISSYVRVSQAPTPSTLSFSAAASFDFRVLLRGQTHLSSCGPPLFTRSASIRPYSSDCLTALPGPSCETLDSGYVTPPHEDNALRWASVVLYTFSEQCRCSWGRLACVLTSYDIRCISVVSCSLSCTSVRIAHKDRCPRCCPRTALLNPLQCRCVHTLIAGSDPCVF